MKKISILVSICVMSATTIAADHLAATTSGDGVWRAIDNSAIRVANLRLPAGSPYKASRLNPDALARQLARAPMERTGDLRKSPSVLSLPGCLAPTNVFILKSRR